MNGSELRSRITAREGRFVKVCCIQSVEEAYRAIEAGADALGLIAAMPSGPGPISDPLISEILSQLPEGVCDSADDAGCVALPQHPARAGMSSQPQPP